MAEDELLLRQAEVDGRRCDVRVVGGHVTQVGRSDGRGADRVIDANGGALLPGLHDHHIHLLACAARAGSVDLADLGVHDHASLATALRGATPADGWLRAVGYHESIAGPLDRDALDLLIADRPLRLQHASGALWILNSAAVDSAGLDTCGEIDGLERDPHGRATGRLWRLDEWLRGRIPPAPIDLAAVGAELRRLGVSGLTDATPTSDPAAVELIARAAADGDLPQRIVITGAAELPADAAPELPRGPVKIILPDHDLPSMSRLLDALAAARRLERAVAIHSVTADSLAVALAALEESGPRTGDRVEHGAVVLPGMHERMARLGLTVVTQPGLVRTRGQRYLAEVDPDELDHLWPCRSLLDHGIPVAAGSDAPFGELDPWMAIAAAADRRTRHGVPLGAHERLPATRALELFLGPLDDPGGPPRRVEPGVPADLCLLDRPLADALRSPSADHVVATIIAGRLE